MLQNNLINLENGNKEIIYNDENIVILEQNNVKYIITKDKELLMTRKDIMNFFQVTERQIKYRVNELKDKGAINEFEKSTKIVPFLKKGLYGRQDIKNPEIYGHNDIIKIGLGLNSEIAIDYLDKSAEILRQVQTKGYYIQSKKIQEVVTQQMTLEEIKETVLKQIERVIKCSKDYNKMNINKIKEIKQHVNHMINNFSFKKVFEDTKHVRINNEGLEKYGMIHEHSQVEFRKNNVAISHHDIEDLKKQSVLKAGTVAIGFLKLYLLPFDDYGLDDFKNVFDRGMNALVDEKINLESDKMKLETVETFNTMCSNVNPLLLGLEKEKVLIE